MNRITDLSGEWQLHPVSEFSTLWLNNDAPIEGWSTQRIPAHWQQESVFKNYSGKMIFRRSFSINPESDGIYRLEIGGVFYQYRLYLNNFALGGARGYFYPTYYHITPYLRENNLLVLEVDSPEPTKNKDLLTGVFAGYTGFPEKYNPGGIWQPVKLLTSGPAYFDHWNLETLELLGDRGRLLMKADIFSSRRAETKLRLVMKPHNFAGPEYSLEFTVYLNKGTNHIEEKLDVTGIHPWWTWDIGDPNLYQVEVSLVENDDTWDFKTDLFGVRTFEFKDFIPYLNGERLFLKGSNYLPVDIYPAKLNREIFEKDLILVKESNQNIVRCYKHIEPQEFYRSADEAGILVWQDFPIKAGFPVNRSAEVINQATEMVKMLTNRASVVIWSIGNLSGYEDNIELNEGRRAHLGLKTLSDRVGKKLKELDRTRVIIPFSGGRGMMSGGGKDTGFGCGVVSGEGEIFSFDRYRSGLARRSIKFVSWFGAPSISEEESGNITLEKPDAEECFERDVRKLNEARVDGKKPHELAVVGQKYQSEVLRFYIDRLRYHKYNPTGGMLLFCFRSIVPGAFWSIVDSSGNTKRSYRTVQLCYRPVYVFALLKKEVYRKGELLHFPICFSNDRHEKNQSAVGIKARLTDVDGQLVWKDQWNVTPAPDATTTVLGQVSVMLMKKGKYVLEINWEDGESVDNMYRILVE